MTEELEPAVHKRPDGAKLGWDAVDVKPEELVDDDWIADNTRRVTNGLDETDSS